MLLQVRVSKSGGRWVVDAAEAEGCGGKGRPSKDPPRRRGDGPMVVVVLAFDEHPKGRIHVIRDVERVPLALLYVSLGATFPFSPILHSSRMDIMGSDAASTRRSRPSIRLRLPEAERVL
jgi:hypothetical protein